MTIEQSMLAALTQGSPTPTSAGDRVYALILPQGTLQPSVSYQRITNTPLADYDGDDGLDNVHMQVKCFGATYAAAKQLGREVRAAFDYANLVVNLSSDADDFEEETKLYVLIQDYMLWGDKAFT